MRTTACVLVLGLIAAAACKRAPDGDPTKVTSTSTDDATAPLVDEDFRFELRWPGAGWKITREADIRKLVPDAVAGVLNGEALFGAIIVESAPGSTAKEFADLLLDQLPVENKNIELRETITYAGVDAERYVVAGRLNGVDFRFVNIVFVRDRFVFQVLGWGQQRHLSATYREMQPFFDAFKPLPGEIKGRVPAPVNEAQGVGWHVKAGVFESGVTGLRARPKDDWRLLVGDPLLRASRDAEVGLTHSNPDVYIVLIPERAAQPSERAALEEHMRSALEGTRGEPYKATFTGAELEMIRVTTSVGVKLEYLHGIHYVDDQVIQVQAWFHAADRERAMKVLPTGLAAFETIPAGETKALLAMMETRRDSQAAIGPAYALRSGVYRNFDTGWQWKKPAGVWRITTGDEAHAVHAEAELALQEPARFLYGLVIPQSNVGVSPEEFHALAVSANPGTKVSARKVGRAQVSTVDGQVGAARFRYDIATLVDDGLGLQIIFWGQKADMENQRAAVDAAIAGFEIGRIEASRRAGELVDNRFGFAVREPGGGLRFKDQTPTGMDAIARVVTWEGNGALFGALAVHFGQSQTDDKWLLDFLEQILRDRVGAANLGRATRTDATLAGVAGRKLTWPGGMTAYVIVRDGTAYGLMTTGVGSPSDFRLLE